MAATPDNPMGLDGFEFVEFASPTAGVVEEVLKRIGFWRLRCIAPKM